MRLNNIMLERAAGEVCSLLSDGHRLVSKFVDIPGGLAVFRFYHEKSSKKVVVIVKPKRLEIRVNSQLVKSEVFAT